jgi:Cytochrome c
MQRSMSRILGSLLSSCVLAGLFVGLCGGREKQEQMQKAHEATPPPSAGAKLYNRHCALCHGSDLKGSGPFPLLTRCLPISLPCRSATATSSLMFT